MASNLVALGAVLLLLLVRSAGTAWLAVAVVGAVAVAKAFYSPAASAALPNVVDPEDLAGGERGGRLGLGHDVGGRRLARRGAERGLRAVRLLLDRRRRPWPWPRSWSWRIRRPLQAPRETRRAPRTRSPRSASRSATSGTARGCWRWSRSSRRSGSATACSPSSRCSRGVYGVGAVGAGLLFAARGLGALVGPLPDAAGADPPLVAAARPRDLDVGLRPRLPRASRSRPGSRWCWCWCSSRTSRGGGNWVMSNYALQAEVPDRLRGRVFATDMMLATLAISVSQLAVARGRGLGRRAGRSWPSCGLVTLLYAIGWRIATRRLSLAERRRGIVVISLR